MFKYVTCGWSDSIKKVEIEKETEKFVYIKDRRIAKLGEYDSYFDTFTQAKGYMYARLLREINGHERQIEALKVRLAKIKKASKWLASHFEYYGIPGRITIDVIDLDEPIRRPE